jgi:membrane peptidoglycan carboxypeptidase
MQLVKNLFLSRRKTLARKLEEVLLVWLLEHHTNINKNRLFEIYLNIIEWGPGIIGANEAAQFYFAKDADALNAIESAYLAAIVPSPRRFAGWFDANGKLVRNDLHFRVIRQVMQNKGMAVHDSSSQVPALYLRGRALNLLRKDSTINTINNTEPWTE